MRIFHGFNRACYRRRLKNHWYTYTYILWFIRHIVQRKMYSLMLCNYISKFFKTTCIIHGKHQNFGELRMYKTGLRTSWWEYFTQRGSILSVCVSMEGKLWEYFPCFIWYKQEPFWRYLYPFYIIIVIIIGRYL